MDKPILHRDLNLAVWKEAERLIFSNNFILQEGDTILVEWQKHGKNSFYFYFLYQDGKFQRKQIKARNFTPTFSLIE